jgi:hypothetical protein
LRSATTHKLIQKIETVAEKYGYTLQTLRAKSLEEAKNIKDYEFINAPHTTTEFYNIEFLIHIDDSNNIWAIFRRHVQKETLSDETIELLSYLGAVRVLFGVKFHTNIAMLSDNVIQIGYDHFNKDFNIERFPKYLRGYKDNNSCSTKNVMIKMHEYVEYIYTYSQYFDVVPCNTKTLYIMNIDITHTIDFSIFPSGLKNIKINGPMVQPICNLPPSVENMVITTCYTQLNEFPANLKILMIGKVYKDIFKNDDYFIIKLLFRDYFHNLMESGEYTDPNDNTTVKIYNINHSSIVFPLGFEHLVLDYCCSLHILKYIKTVPETFTKLSIDNVKHLKPVDDGIDSYYKKIIQINTEIIGNFKMRFPNIVIEYFDTDILIRTF